MMPIYPQILDQLNATSHTWLITGVAGFIGSNLLKTLLNLNQDVAGLDNFSTGYRHNLDEVQQQVTPKQWQRFRFIEGDIRNLSDCQRGCEGVEFVLHQAALGSVPRSIKEPLLTNAVNIDGFLNMLVASRDAKIRRFIYAASSAAYGDHPGLPKVEDTIGRPLSPYAVTKYANEIYADVFARSYGLDSIGLRYFNVFGPHQDPGGPYAAVIPQWIASMMSGTPVYINGDGETSRDFCYVDNVTQINILAAMTSQPEAINQVYNVAVGERTTLNELYRYIYENIAQHMPQMEKTTPLYRDFRPGDVRHSLADISKAKHLLSYAPSHNVSEGLKIAMKWYLSPKQTTNTAQQ